MPSDLHPVFNPKSGSVFGSVSRGLPALIKESRSTVLPPDPTPL